MKPLSFQLYGRFPVSAQNLIVSTYGAYLKWLRYGRPYKNFSDIVKQNESSSWEELEVLQQKKLRELIVFAHANVPYYRNLFRKIGFAPSDFRTMEDLTDLPILEKSLILSKGHQLVAENFSRWQLCRNTTSGTTGTPMTLFSERDTWKWNYAFHELRSRNWAGVSVKDKRVMFGGKPIVPIHQQRPPFWRYNPFESQMYMSNFHLGPASIASYARALQHFKPVYLTGFPSAITLLASLLRKKNLTVPQATAVIVSGEQLSDFQRKTMEHVFGCRIYDQWGSGERVGFASECAAGGLHVSPDYGVVEILRNGRPAKPGELGEVICTGLINFAMPLIRYRIGDVAIPSDEKCSCGSELPLIESVAGKVNDIVTTPGGKYVTHLSGAIFSFAKNIQRGQIVQEKIDQLIMKVVPSEGFSSHDAARLKKIARECVGIGMKISVETVGEIPLTPGGKFRGVISHVDPEIH